MKRILNCSVFVLLAMLSFAQTYYVAPSGNDATGNGSAANPWKTLRNATITVSAAGSTIHLMAGTYIESGVTQSLAAGVNLEGDGKSTTIVKSTVTGDWSVFLALESSSPTNGNQRISGITFDGGYVSESNYKTWWGIHVSRRSNVIINDCAIINFYDRGVNFDGNGVWNPLVDPGIYATGNKFYNNTLSNTARCTAGYGAGQLNIGGQNGMEIYGNTMTSTQRPNFKNGWPIKYWENGWLRGVKIYNNTLTKAPYAGTYPGENGDWDFAIELFNISGLEIYSNIIQGSIDLNYNYKGSYSFSAWIHHNTVNHPTNANFESGIILEFATQSAIIEDNNFNNTSTGVQFNTRGPGNSGGYNYPAPTGGYSALTGNVIRRNLFSNIYRGNGSAVGVFSEGTDDPYVDGLTITNNTFIAKSGNAPWWGIDFSSQPNGTMKNVTINNNIVMGFAGGWIVGTASRTNINGLTLKNNLTWNNANGNLPSWPGGNPTSYTNQGNIQVNPNLNITTYKPNAGSPAINAGTDGTDIGFTGGGATSPPPTPCNFLYGPWSACSGGFETRSVAVSPLGCTGTPPADSIRRPCTVQNIAPLADAGADKSFTLPTTSIALLGNGTDLDGSIVSYKWTSTGGTFSNANAQNPTFTATAAGTYTVTLTVTDNLGATGSDNAVITVNPQVQVNQPPVVTVGPDITIKESFALTSDATDDGTIMSYKWTKLSGPACTIVTPNANDTEVLYNSKGTYKFQIAVKDDKGATTKKVVTVIIQ